MIEREFRRCYFQRKRLVESVQLKTGVENYNLKLAYASVAFQTLERVLITDSDQL